VGGLDLCHSRREKRSGEKSRRWRWAVAGTRKVELVAYFRPQAIVLGAVECCCCCSGPWVVTGFRIPSLHVSAAVSQHDECIKDHQSQSHRQEIRHDSIRRPSRSVGVHGVLARRPAVPAALCSPEKWLQPPCGFAGKVQRTSGTAHRRWRLNNQV